MIIVVVLIQCIFLGGVCCEPSEGLIKLGSANIAPEMLHIENKGPIHLVILYNVEVFHVSVSMAPLWHQGTIAPRTPKNN